jgi:hypothetical protein
LNKFYASKKDPFCKCLFFLIIMLAILWLMESTFFPGKISHFLENGGIWMINHIFKVLYFKIQFAWPTFQKRSWTVMMIMSTNRKKNAWGIPSMETYLTRKKRHKHRGNSFQCQNYKMRLKQRSLNWINSMQVKKILFTNVFFSWSLCLLNMFPILIIAVKLILFLSSLWISFHYPKK